MLCTVAGMTGMYHLPQLFLVEMGSSKHFCLGCPGTAVLPISVFKVIRITGMSHQCWLHYLTMLLGTPITCRHKSKSTMKAAGVYWELLGLLLKSSSQYVFLKETHNKSSIS
jgi:hypothetical protein